MKQTIERTSIFERHRFSAHPLEPLSKTEIRSAVSIIKDDPRVTEDVRFVTIMLNEPDKKMVLEYAPEDEKMFERQALVILLDNNTQQCVEDVVSLNLSAMVIVINSEPRRSDICVFSIVSIRSPVRISVMWSQPQGLFWMIAVNHCS